MHSWTKSDEIAVFKLYVKGATKETITKLSNELNISTASIICKLQNYRYLDKKEGLSHVSKLSKIIYEENKEMIKVEHN